LTALGARLRLRSAAGELDLPVEKIWNGIASSALLTAIAIPLRRGLRLDYARELRPIMTQAIGRDDAGRGRIVTATEHVRPRLRELTDGKVVAGGAAFDFDDPITGAAYLRRVSDTLLARQLERMKAA
jgi:hypothetical protein